MDTPEQWIVQIPAVDAIGLCQTISELARLVHAVGQPDVIDADVLAAARALSRSALRRVGAMNVGPLRMLG